MGYNVRGNPNGDQVREGHGTSHSAHTVLPGSSQTMNAPCGRPQKNDECHEGLAPLPDLANLLINFNY
jgi:hypothetical protein